MPLARCGFVERNLCSASKGTFVNVWVPTETRRRPSSPLSCEQQAVQYSSIELSMPRTVFRNENASEWNMYGRARTHHARQVRAQATRSLLDMGSLRSCGAESSRGGVKSVKTSSRSSAGKVSLFILCIVKGSWCQARIRVRLYISKAPRRSHLRFDRLSFGCVKGAMRRRS